MAVLTATQRRAVWADLMERLSHRREPIALLKADLRAGIDAADDWVEANQASFNTALPGTARTGLTAAQKAEILAYVVLKRFGG